MQYIYIFGKVVKIDEDLAIEVRLTYLSISMADGSLRLCVA